ncbi:MAG: HAD family hydrolase [Roseiarcus sp.]
MSGEASWDWDALRLVAFDVDGTLYDQAALRRAMALELLAHCARRASLRPLRILAIYRSRRESMAEAETQGFDRLLTADVARRCDCTEQVVAATVAEWIGRRPLPRLSGSRYPGLVALFAALKRRGKIIGIVSDYPAREKLEALGLGADLIVSATDEEVGVLKPHPRGLEALMRRAGVTPGRTLLIGDRRERDGEAARRAGAFSLIRSGRRAGAGGFAHYDDPVFAPLLRD